VIGRVLSATLEGKVDVSEQSRWRATATTWVNKIVALLSHRGQASDLSRELRHRGSPSLDIAQFLGGGRGVPGEGRGAAEVSEQLFDTEGLIEDVKLTLREGPIANPARAGFLAGMLSTWTLGPGVKPSAAEKEAFLDIAREALARARAAAGAE
jgi:hypothetical protein